MVFGIFTKKIAKDRIFRDLARTERHFFNAMTKAEEPLDVIRQEFEDIRSELLPTSNPALIPNLLRFEEMAYGVLMSFYMLRILSGVRAVAKTRSLTPDMAAYKLMLSTHYRFLSKLSKADSGKEKAVAVFMPTIYNRQFEVLNQLTKLSVLLGEVPQKEYRTAAKSLLHLADEDRCMTTEVAPYANLYPEESANVRKNYMRQYLLTTFLNAGLPGSDIDTADVLMRSASFEKAEFTPRPTPATTHYIPHDNKSLLKRVHPGLKEGQATSYFSGQGLVEALSGMEKTIGRFVNETALGETFTPVLNAKSVKRVLGLWQTARDSDRVAVDLRVEVFTDITDCMCYLRRVHEDYLIHLCDDNRQRHFNVYERFEEMKFGYVSSVTRDMVSDNIGARLLAEMEHRYDRKNVIPDIWQVENVSTHGYGLSVPKEVKPPAVGSLVILSKEDDNSIQFAAVRRTRSDESRHLIGVESLYADCDVEPVFIRSCSEKGPAKSYQRAEPYGFMLTDSQTGRSTLLLAKLEALPLRSGVVVRSVHGDNEGIITAEAGSWSNCTAYTFDAIRRGQDTIGKRDHA